jgi:alpha-glucosidase (family GH31 glycosyl hydrolase)
LQVAGGRLKLEASDEQFSGTTPLKQVTSPLGRLSLFVRHGSEITFAEPVEHTGQLEQAQRVTILFDESYHGLEASALGKWIML